MKKKISYSSIALISLCLTYCTAFANQNLSNCDLELIDSLRVERHNFIQEQPVDLPIPRGDLVVISDDQSHIFISSLSKRDEPYFRHTQQPSASRAALLKADATILEQTLGTLFNQLIYAHYPFSLDIISEEHIESQDKAAASANSHYSNMLRYSAHNVLSNQYINLIKERIFRDFTDYYSEDAFEKLAEYVVLSARNAIRNLKLALEFYEADLRGPQNRDITRSHREELRQRISEMKKTEDTLKKIATSPHNFISMVWRVYLDRGFADPNAMVKLKAPNTKQFVLTGFPKHMRLQTEPQH